MEPSKTYWIAVTQAAIRHGFTGTSNNGLFVHPDIPNQTFDFSATDPSKIMLSAWQQAVKHGRNQKSKDILSMLEEE
jgi:hypothetical protein